MSSAWTRVTAIGFVVAILVSEILKGESPSPSGPASEIVSFFADGRSSILAGAYVQMLALFLLALVMSALWNTADPARPLPRRLGWLGLTLTLGAYTTYVFLTAALAFGAAVDAGAPVAKALWEMRFVAETFINFPVALLIAGTSRLFPMHTRPWYRWGSAAIAAAFLVGGAALARNGFLAPDGGYGFLLFWLLPLWVVATAFTVRPMASAE